MTHHRLILAAFLFGLLVVALPALMFPAGAFFFGWLLLVDEVVIVAGVDPDGWPEWLEAAQ